MRIAITGAAGHLGSALLRSLLAEDQVEDLLLLDLHPVTSADPRVRFERWDVRDAGLERRLEGIDTLVHLAFIVETGARNEPLVEAVNVGGSQNVLRAAGAAKVPHVVYTSSIASYGFHPENGLALLDETSPIRGNDDFYYTRTKAAVERWLDRFQEEHPSMAVTRLRPSAFADGTGRGGMLFGGPIHIYPVSPAGRAIPVHLTHQEDVVAAVRLALEAKPNGAFNVASDEPIPLQEWGQVLGKRSVRLPNLLRGPLKLAYKLRLVDMHPGWLHYMTHAPIAVSSEKIKRELGWSPRYPTTRHAIQAVAKAAHG